MTDLEHDALILLGFQFVDGGYARAWRGVDAEMHVLTIAKLQTGWGLVWQRGTGYTLAETRAKTFGDLMDAMWGTIFRITEHHVASLKAEAKRNAGRDGDT